MTVKDFVVKNCPTAYCEEVNRVSLGKYYFIRFDDKNFKFIGSGYTELKAWTNAKESILKSKQSYIRYKTENSNEVD